MPDTPQPDAPGLSDDEVSRYSALDQKARGGGLSDQEMNDYQTLDQKARGGAPKTGWMGRVTPSTQQYDLDPPAPEPQAVTDFRNAGQMGEAGRIAQTRKQRLDVSMQEWRRQNAKDTAGIDLPSIPEEFAKDAIGNVVDPLKRAAEKGTVGGWARGVVGAGLGAVGDLTGASVLQTGLRLGDETAKEQGPDTSLASKLATGAMRWAPTPNTGFVPMGGFEQYGEHVIKPLDKIAEDERRIKAAGGSTFAGAEQLGEGAALAAEVAPLIAGHAVAKAGGRFMDPAARATPMGQRLAYANDATALPTGSTDAAALAARLRAQGVEPSLRPPQPVPAPAPVDPALSDNQLAVEQPKSQPRSHVNPWRKVTLETGSEPSTPQLDSAGRPRGAQTQTVQGENNPPTTRIVNPGNEQDRLARVSKNLREPSAAEVRKGKPRPQPIRDQPTEGENQVFFPRIKGAFDETMTEARPGDDPRNDGRPGWLPKSRGDPPVSGGQGVFRGASGEREDYTPPRPEGYEASTQAAIDVRFWEKVRKQEQYLGRPLTATEWFALRGEDWTARTRRGGDKWGTEDGPVIDHVLTTPRLLGNSGPEYEVPHENEAPTSPTAPPVPKERPFRIDRGRGTIPNKVRVPQPMETPVTHRDSQGGEPPEPVAPPPPPAPEPQGPRRGKSQNVSERAGRIREALAKSQEGELLQRALGGDKKAAKQFLRQMEGDSVIARRVAAAVKAAVPDATSEDFIHAVTGEYPGTRTAYSAEVTDTPEPPKPEPPPGPPRGLPNSRIAETPPVGRMPAQPQNVAGVSPETGTSEPASVAGDVAEVSPPSGNRLRKGRKPAAPPLVAETAPETPPPEPEQAPPAPEPPQAQAPKPRERQALRPDVTVDPEGRPMKRSENADKTLGEWTPMSDDEVAALKRKHPQGWNEKQLERETPPPDEPPPRGRRGNTWSKLSSAEQSKRVRAALGKDTRQFTPTGDVVPPETTTEGAPAERLQTNEELDAANAARARSTKPPYGSDWNRADESRYHHLHDTGEDPSELADLSQRRSLARSARQNERLSPEDRAALTAMNEADAEDGNASDDATAEHPQAAALRDEAARRRKDAGTSHGIPARVQKIVADAYDRAAKGEDPEKIAAEIRAKHKDPAATDVPDDMKDIPELNRTVGDEAAGQFSSNLPQDVEAAKAAKPKTGRFRKGGQRGAMRFGGGGMGGGGSMSREGNLGEGFSDAVDAAGKGAAEVAGKVAESAGDAGRAAGGLSSTYRGKLRKYGPDGDRLYRGTQDVERISQKNENNFLMDEQNAWDKVPRAERPQFERDLRGIVEGRKAPASEAQGEYVAWWRKAATDVADIANDSGVRIVDENGVRKVPSGWQQFFPQILKPEIVQRLRSGDPEITARFLKENVGDGKAFETRADADEALKSYRNPQLKSFHPGTELPRKVHWPDEWVMESGRKAVRSYATRAIQNAAEHKVWRFRDAETGKLRGHGGEGDLGDALAAIHDEHGQGGAAEAKAVTLRILRRNPEDWGKGGRAWRNVNAVEGAFHAARMYTNPKTWIAQGSQFPLLAAEVGPEIAAKALGRVLKNPRAAYERGARGGAYRPVTQFSSTIGFDSDPVGRAGEAAAGLSNKMLAPMGLHDAFQRSIAVEAANDYGPKLTEALQKGGKSEAWARRRMTAMDLSDEQQTRFAENKANADDMDKLRHELVKITQGEASTGERLPPAANPQLHTLFRGKNFNISQARNTWRVAGTELANGNVKPAVTLLVGAVIVGEGLAGMKGAMFGPDPKRPSLDEVNKKAMRGHFMPFVQRAARDLKEASVGGIGGDMILSAVPTPQGRTSVSDTVKHTIAWPTGELAVDTLDSAGKIVRPPVHTRSRTPRMDEFERWLRTAFPGPHAFKEIFDAATPHGVRNKLKKGSSYRDYDRQLRDREKTLKEAFKF